LLITLLLSGLIVFSTYATSNKSDVKLTKNITKSFLVGAKPEVDVSNKYGKVIVTGWDKDSVKISVDIVAYGKNSETVEKMIAKVDVDFMHNAGYLAVETQMNRRRGNFGGLISDLEGYGKTFLNSNKLTIDYTIYVPKATVFSLENKFGDVFLDKLYGTIDLDLSHGDLKARELQGKANIQLSYGNGRIKTMKEGFIKLKGGEIDVQEGDEIDVESSSSELIFGDIKSLLISSRNDKIRAGSVRVLKGTGDFTDIFVSEVNNELDINMEYGELYVERIGEDFSSILINSKAADINLVISPESYFSANISGSEDRMIIPNSMLSLGKKNTKDSDYDFTLSGEVGPTRSTKGKVAIKSMNADLIISIKETGIFTRKD
ncbi:MAG: hypothetical protein WBA74_18955, partial [Cyclobacteriaceae bacterium]